MRTLINALCVDENLDFSFSDHQYITKDLQFPPFTWIFISKDRGGERGSLLLKSDLLYDKLETFKLKTFFM